MHSNRATDNNTVEICTELDDTFYQSFISLGGIRLNTVTGEHGQET